MTTDLAQILANSSHSFRRANAHLAYSTGNKVKMPDGATAVCLEATAPVKPQGRRVRQGAKGPNKLEAAWGLNLAQYPELTGLQFNALTLVIANGVRYTPDWSGWLDGTLTCWEVKGKHAFGGSLEKLKVAARVWPEVTWILVWQDGGQWKAQEILS